MGGKKGKDTLIRTVHRCFATLFQKFEMIEYSSDLAVRCVVTCLYFHVGQTWVVYLTDGGKDTIQFPFTDQISNGDVTRFYQQRQVAFDRTDRQSSSFSDLCRRIAGIEQRQGIHEACAFLSF